MISDFKVFKGAAGNVVYLHKNCIESFEPAEWGVRVSTKSGDSHSFFVPLEYFVAQMFDIKLLIGATVADA